MAAAKHIVKSLAVSKNAADDMMRFLSTYDPRLLPLSSPDTGEEEEEDDDDEEEELIASAEEVILRCNSSPSGPGTIDDDYLYAVDDATAASARSTRAAAAVHAAMPRLEEELRALLLASSSSSSPRRLSDDLAGDATTSPPRHDDDGDGATLSPDAAAAARAVAGRMLRAGYGPELAQAYVSVRRDALADSVAQLGVEAVSIEEVLRMDWPALDPKMRRWAHAVRPAVRAHLGAERRLCDEVFESDAQVGHACFADVARGSVLQLLGFACAAAMAARRAPEKLFRVVAMYDALADVRADLEALFSGNDDAFVRDFFAGEASAAASQLADAVRATVEELGHVIRGEASRRPVLGGEIHPMTRYVLNYCALLADSRDTLDAVLLVNGDDDQVNGAGGDLTLVTPSARCMLKLMTLLLRNMDDKAALYDDAGLQNIFLMNNLYYVVHKVMETPPLRELLGDDWLRRHRGQIRQHETGYLRASWIAVLSGLRDDGGGAPAPAKMTRSSSAAAHDRAVRDQARAFNAAFEEMYRAQTAWKVADPQLREELRIAVSERLIPAYRSFLGRASRVSGGRHVKFYSLEDLENYMLDFFEGVQKFVR
ncbi:hypothetical protein PR202_ga21655 [Eleusine coracana subsp. coracana]|uniref:Exocyst subunit Exo70 family protein n=1 Tax=Eleusine coracana subsp. coracana TaxID=191504 RepID=A0AAV5D226_ELECO|nr:hypothetical protein PR202_ga21655 [Eleusine coracana subsp. coracana]